MLQDHLLYFSERIPHDAMAREARATGLVPWPAAGGYRGLLRAPAGPPRATLLLHGNAGHAGQRDNYADVLVP